MYKDVTAIETQVGEEQKFFRHGCFRLISTQMHLRELRKLGTPHLMGNPDLAHAVGEPDVACSDVIIGLGSG